MSCTNMIIIRRRKITTTGGGTEQNGFKWKCFYSYYYKVRLTWKHCPVSFIVQVLE